MKEDNEDNEGSETHFSFADIARAHRAFGFTKPDAESVMKAHGTIENLTLGNLEIIAEHFDDKQKRDDDDSEKDRAAANMHWDWLAQFAWTIESVVIGEDGCSSIIYGLFSWWRTHEKLWWVGFGADIGSKHRVFREWDSYASKETFKGQSRAAKWWRANRKRIMEAYR